MDTYWPTPQGPLILCCRNFLTAQVANWRWDQGNGANFTGLSLSVLFIKKKNFHGKDYVIHWSHRWSVIPARLRGLSERSCRICHCARSRSRRPCVWGLDAEAGPRHPEHCILQWGGKTGVMHPLTRILIRWPSAKHLNERAYVMQASLSSSNTDDYNSYRGRVFFCLFNKVMDKLSVVVRCQLAVTTTEYVPFILWLCKRLPL